jgi:hypothetical protein
MFVACRHVTTRIYIKQITINLIQTDDLFIYYFFAIKRRFINNGVGIRGGLMQLSSDREMRAI